MEATIERQRDKKSERETHTSADLERLTDGETKRERESQIEEKEKKCNRKIPSFTLKASFVLSSTSLS